MASNHKKEDGQDDIVVEHIVLTSEEDVPAPPPPKLWSNFKTLQEWLFSICDTEKPQKAIATYNFGLFESPDNYVLFIIGVNRHDSDAQHSVTRIEFQPANGYFPLPKSEYEGLTQEQVWERLTKQLEDFINTDTFKQSFLRDAESITTDWKAVIWKQ